MADTKLTALTELTTPALDDWLYAVDKSDTTDDAAGSSRKIATSTLLKMYGGLTPNAQTITTADVTGAVGQLYVCTIAGLTANRNLTLPSASAGERVGVYVVDGDDTYALILKGAASQTINGGSAATEWSRVFIAGECVVFICTAANTWIVESDGRIPQHGMLNLTSNSASRLTNNTIVALDFNEVVRNTGSIAVLANDRFEPRRQGHYHTIVAFRAAAAASGIAIGVLRDAQGASTAIDYRGPSVTSFGSASDGGVSVVHYVQLADVGTTAGYLVPFGFQNSGSNRDQSGASSPVYLSYSICTEVL